VTGSWARLLTARGARVKRLWHAAALGMTDRAEELLGSEQPPTKAEIDHAFWQACHGGQRRMAEFLLARGADINAIPDHTKQTPLDIGPGPDTRREAVVSWLRDHGAGPPRTVQPRNLTTRQLPAPQPSNPKLSPPSPNIITTRNPHWPIYARVRTPPWPVVGGELMSYVCLLLRFFA
jgi:hypothetical protein